MPPDALDALHEVRARPRRRHATHDGAVSLNEAFDSLTHSRGGSRPEPVAHDQPLGAQPKPTESSTSSAFEVAAAMALGAEGGPRTLADGVGSRSPATVDRFHFERTREQRERGAVPYHMLGSRRRARETQRSARR